MTKPVLRAAGEEDLEGLIRVKDAASEGWGERPPAGEERRIDGQRALFRHLLEHGTAVLASADEGVVGFGAAIRRDDVWFLSQLFVRPDGQGAGTGAAILDELLGRDDAGGARVRAVVSSSDPRALGLYLSRGMLPAWQMLRFARRVPTSAGSPVALEGSPVTLEPIRDGDRDGIDALDVEVRGFTRRVDHAFLASVARGFVLRRDGALAAYAYVHEDGGVGPLVAADAAALRDAVAAADALAGPGAGWSVPSTAPALIRALLERGHRPGWTTTFCSDGPLGLFDRTALAGGALL